MRTSLISLTIFSFVLLILIGCSKPREAAASERAAVAQAPRIALTGDAVRDVRATFSKLLECAAAHDFPVVVAFFDAPDAKLYGPVLNHGRIVTKFNRFWQLVDAKFGAAGSTPQLRTLRGMQLPEFYTMLTDRFCNTRADDCAYEVRDDGVLVVTPNGLDRWLWVQRGDAWKIKLAPEPTNLENLDIIARMTAMEDTLDTLIAGIEDGSITPVNIDLQLNRLRDSRRTQAQQMVAEYEQTLTR